MAVALWKRAVLIPILLFSLYLLTDNETSDSKRFHHLAVMTALNRHRPCMRVYRSLLELNLLLWGAVVSLWLWTRTLGTRMIGYLLFQPVHDDLKSYLAHNADADSGDYLPVEAEEIFNEDSTTESKQAETHQSSEKESFDAHYESDGEVEEPIVLGQFDPPTVEQVTGVAVDTLVLILISLFLFTFSSAEGGVYVDGISNVGLLKTIAWVAAPIFPLLLFLGIMVSCVIPWTRRVQFWKIISFTIGAPFYHVTFRDGFIGDIFTSAVRPMQDTAFTLFYLVSGLQGWWQQAYNLDSADLPLESNWLLHTCILPMCMISPLWWRFCQNLRQSYEAKQRWPYLGNALKYFIAAEVAMFGVFNPSRRQSGLWLLCFVLATLYQIWWDTFMDWELLDLKGGKIRLRQTRIYSVQWLYWGIFGINVVLRFCWTLSFLPPHYLNKAGVLSETFEGDLTHILNPTIASAEIVRRVLWGFLRVEWEAIKVGRKEPRLKGTWTDNDPSQFEEGQVELQVMRMQTATDQPYQPSSGPKKLTSDMSGMTDLQVMGELCVYATIFTGIGMVAAAHRMTL